MIYDRFDFTGYISNIPIKPKKPAFPRNPNASDAAKFAVDMAIYESAMVDYDNQMKERAHKYAAVHAQFRATLAAEYLTDELMSTETEARIWESAWSECHSHGYAEMERYYENAAKIANSAAYAAHRTR